MDRWYDSRFTGLFSQLDRVPLRPHDPDVPLWSGQFPSWNALGPSRTAGGAGWDATHAEAACVGEAIERLDPAPLPDDAVIEASWQAWPLDAPAVDPGRWVQFHPEQYAQLNFPFQPFTRETVCRWVCFRQASTGSPMWVPEELAFLEPRDNAPHRLCPGVSTGLSCGQQGQPVLLRGLQEAIERDAILGAWWDRYPVEEWPGPVVSDSLDCSLTSLEAPLHRTRGRGVGVRGQAIATTNPLTPDPSPPEYRGRGGHWLSNRLLRPNLRYRFYRVDTPFSSHVTMATLEGEDHEGYCFSIGSACRESRDASWRKSILEAVQGRHYVRALKTVFANRPCGDVPADFPEHAVHYSLHPDQLPATVLHRARPISAGAVPGAEGVAELVARLGPDRPVLFRNMTPVGIASQVREWYVLRVLVPGLQPLHGNDAFPHLGGGLWAPRGLAAWSSVPPHPFP